ncbi:glycosyltransferase, partial [Bacillus safensis]
MSVLFIAPSQFSIGELHNAVTLAKQLEEGGIKTFFLTSQNHINYVLNANMKAKALPRKTLQSHIVKDTAETIKAKAIIIADYHNLDIESP